MRPNDIENLINQYEDVLSCFFHYMSDMIFLMSVEEGTRFRYVLMNPPAMQVSKLTEDAYGKQIEDVYPEEKAATLNSMYRDAVKAGKPIYFTTYGDIIGESLLTPIFNSEGVCTHVLTVTRDLTERKKLETQLEFMAYHDALTGLPNRRLLMDRMKQAMSQAKHMGRQIAVLYLDCDYFKEINDTWGHAVGDEFLRVLAKKLSSCVREVDTVARLGGDEFILLLSSLDSAEEAAKVAKRVLQTLQEPWVIQQHSFTLTMSIGIAVYPRDGTTINELLRHADIALYRSKEAGRNQFCFYSSSME
ncbi:GGDEF domain-containing protein [Brevibacillus ruminantium]|uniref:GGDEF domain-containing protein n=1 Tax=Brevibacillus ruminantium TaxID=2950604 RepID=A0ABY4WHD0_9BACL|nr:sensor domain-containing diguanylate cyclase [Brevibacillus ruminantium]USG66453.1 GGDEF domain-containing protein [Brevibacillus ruminantium]